jgi:hypothetical protein
MGILYYIVLYHTLKIKQEPPRSGFFMRQAIRAVPNTPHQAIGLA